MANIEINFDRETGYYDAVILSKGITTQAKSLDQLIKNLSESISLSNKQDFILTHFNISFDDKYVNI